MISSYVTYPEDKSTHHAVLFLTDGFGHEFINNRLVADQLAANGYFVVMPDLFDGDAVPADTRPADFDLQGWLAKHQTPVVDPIVASVLKGMRGTLGCKRVGAVGYCFGAKYVVRFLKGGESIDTGFVAHPSLVEFDEIRGIKGPLSIAAAGKSRTAPNKSLWLQFTTNNSRESDFIFDNAKRHQSEDILAEMKATYQVVLYSGTEHGFAIRADLSKKHLRFAKEQAFLQAVRWLDEYVKA
ncbi:vacuolar protein sorting-associated protein 45 [Neofusicoccum ribis]|uniref:Vacuolar protein sorting-associated protein 45 n=1 Tax=Neofusicoccum ribis TaxID=45134 RepID=A0ABR3SD21_9PEZI